MEAIGQRGWSHLEQMRASTRKNQRQSLITKNDIHLVAVCGLIATILILILK
jgi:hypothetical protein